MWLVMNLSVSEQSVIHHFNDFFFCMYDWMFWDYILNFQIVIIVYVGYHGHICVVHLQFWTKRSDTWKRLQIDVAVCDYVDANGPVAIVDRIHSWGNNSSRNDRPRSIYILLGYYFRFQDAIINRSYNEWNLIVGQTPSTDVLRILLNILRHNRIGAIQLDIPFIVFFC